MNGSPVGRPFYYGVTVYLMTSRFVTIPHDSAWGVGWSYNCVNHKSVYFGISSQQYGSPAETKLLNATPTGNIKEGAGFIALHGTGNRVLLHTYAAKQCTFRVQAVQGSAHLIPAVPALPPARLKALQTRLNSRQKSEVAGILNGCDCP